MAREILEEVRKNEPSPEFAQELASLHGRVQQNLFESLPNALVEELEAIKLDLPLSNGATPEEIRVAYSGLIGWLGGLFQGLQASAQVQMAMQMQRAQETSEIPSDSEQEPEEQPEGYL